MLDKKKMEKRQQELTELTQYIEKIDKETTLLLQNLQWDNKHLIKSTTMVSCQYVASHKIPLDRRKSHEEQCYLTQLGYSKEDVLLPDPIDPNANTVVKLSKQDIRRIINTAASSNPSFKRGIICPGPEPLSAERLQQTYTADERRAIHDAVVSAAPACHDLAELALASAGEKSNKTKSRLEILAELRDMRRRRTKYRVAAKTRNYSDALRDVIRTQMELYAEAKGIFIKTEYGSKNYVSIHRAIETTPTNIVFKQERISSEADYNYESSRRQRKRSNSRDRREHFNHRPIQMITTTNTIIKQERIFPEADYNYEISRQHRERSISRDRRRRDYFDHRPIQTTSSNTVIKQERVSPESDESSRRHREKYTSRDRRRRQFYDGDHASKKRRHDSVDKNRYSDKYTEHERNRYNDYHEPIQHEDLNIKEEDVVADDRRSHNDGTRDYYYVQKPSASKDSRKYDESRSGHSKHDRYYRKDSSKNTSKYDDETKRVRDKYDKSYKKDTRKSVNDSQ